MNRTIEFTVIAIVLSLIFSGCIMMMGGHRHGSGIVNCGMHDHSAKHDSTELNHANLHRHQDMADSSNAVIPPDSTDRR